VPLISRASLPEQVEEEDWVEPTTADSPGKRPLQYRWWW